MDCKTVLIILSLFNLAMLHSSWTVYQKAKKKMEVKNEKNNQE